LILKESWLSLNVFKCKEYNIGVDVVDVLACIRIALRFNVNCCNIVTTEERKLDWINV